MHDGRAVVWERGGRVWVVNTNGTRNAAPLIDLNDEVGAWRDYGLMSVVLDPHFEKNGHFYLLYVVDRHHLDFFGTAQYSKFTNTYFAATIGRITRYTATAASNRSVADTSTRLVLLGETAASGIPIVHQSHGPGSLMFGEDGTLLVTTGDAASYIEVDVGGQVGDGYVNDGLARGILRAKENVGAFRSQLVDCLNGKVLRLDPATGNGVPSNPWFQASAPRSARSRAFALGLRNPFRATIVPASGDHDPAAGNPGVLHIGDVGWGTWEEVTRAATRGANLGWPLFEGLDYHDGYFAASPFNLDAPTGLTAPSPTHHRFRDLVRQDSLDATATLALDPNSFQQSEVAAASGVITSNAYSGCFGDGYRDYQAASGEWIEHTFNVSTSGTYTLWIRHANGGTAARSLRVAVDGATWKLGRVATRFNQYRAQQRNPQDSLHFNGVERAEHRCGGARARGSTAANARVGDSNVDASSTDDRLEPCDVDVAHTDVHAQRSECDNRRSYGRCRRFSIRWLLCDRRSDHRSHRLAGIAARHGFLRGLRLELHSHHDALTERQCHFAWCI
jgi:glucose/arabinose dehydrogenase